MLILSVWRSRIVVKVVCLSSRASLFHGGLRHGKESGESVKSQSRFPVAYLMS